MQFICPHCNSETPINPNVIGQTGNCPHCGKSVTITDETVTNETPPGDLLAAPTPTMRQPPSVGYKHAPTTNIYTPAGQPSAVQINVQNTQSSNSLGIASLILAICSFFICWLPFINITISGLALLLGVAAFLLSATRRGSGIGYGVAGIALSGTSLLLGIFFMLALGGAGEAMNQAVIEMEKNRDASDAILIEPQIDASDAELPAVAPQAITKAQYDRLKNGMSYGDTVATLGFHGEELSSSHMDGVPGVIESIDTVMYIWKNSDGSNMNAMFQNDSLMQKAQFGLK